MWPHMFNDFFKGFEFSVYSLYDDLYEKRPFKGDLHMHTIGSDGLESTRLTAAQYRKWGFDYISITDHMLMEPSLEAIEEYKEIPTSLKIFPGEEVHQQFPRGSFHMVNFNGKRSVNEILRNEPERAELEMEKIAETIDLNNEEDRKELAWFKWVYDEIKKAGGIAIYPHPFWVIIDALNIRTSTSKEIYKRGYTDVYEILGGTCDKEHNRMQVQMYYDMCSKGVNLPIVAATDSHSAINHGEKQFDQVWTITFSEKSDKIPENILKGYSTAVDNYVVTDKNVYGALRLVNYTWFLIQNYYEMHDELCFSAGQAIVRYVLGDKTQKDLIAALENEIKKFNDSFFGKK
jgi:predicted metal-dependent phosphoesterase TrpH